MTYRIITVPENIHQALPNIGNAPLHEFEGKNIGIRFARGEFVVCTNQGKQQKRMIVAGCHLTRLDAL